MAKLLYSATMSVDGFIAGPGGDMSWLSEHLEPDPVLDDLVTSIGALLVGRRTYGGDDPNRGDPDKEGQAFGGGWQGPQFVLTHRPPDTPVPGVTFVTDFDTAVSTAKDAAGDTYVNVLGANVVKQCVEAGVLDEILVILVPVLLGDGVRLFDNPGGVSVGLERITSTQAPRSNALWFGVVR